MRVGNDILKKGCIIKILYHTPELVGQIEYIDNKGYLHGTWGNEIINPQFQGFVLLRTHYGKLTDMGINYNSLHPSDTI